MTSICDSRAKLLAVAARARYAPCGSGDAAGWWTTRQLGTRYGVISAAGPELMFVIDQAESRPPRSDPAATSITAAGRRCPQVNSSPRLHCTFTGRSTAWASRAASIATVAPCLPPKPPPKSGTITRASSSSTPRASANSRRTLNGVCVPVHTVTRPSRHSASAARGSSGAWAM